MPAPTALTPENEADVLAAIRSGASESIAAGYAGLHRDTVAHWRRTGLAAVEKPPRERTEFEEKCVGFSARLAKAHSDAIVGFSTIVSQLARGGAPRHADPNDDDSPLIEPTIEEKNLAFRASTWMLERRQKEDYSTRTEVTGADGGAIIVENEFSADLLKRIAETDAAAQRMREAAATEP